MVGVETDNHRVTQVGLSFRELERRAEMLVAIIPKPMADDGQVKRDERRRQRENRQKKYAAFGIGNVFDCVFFRHSEWRQPD